MQIMPKAPNNLGSNYLITKPADQNLSIISPAENLAFLYYYLNHTRNTKDMYSIASSLDDSFKIKFHFFISWHIKIFIQMIEKLLFSMSKNLQFDGYFCAVSSTSILNILLKMELNNSFFK